MKKTSPSLHTFLRPNRAPPGFENFFENLAPVYQFQVQIVREGKMVSLGLKWIFLMHLNWFEWTSPHLKEPRNLHQSVIPVSLPETG